MFSYVFFEIRARSGRRKKGDAEGEHGAADAQPPADPAMRRSVAKRLAGLQIGGSKFQSSNSNSRELELTK